MSRSLTQDARYIVKRLREQGHCAYWAGGCVRDRLLGLPPQDIDIATDATPEEVAKRFRRTVMVGAHFGVVVVLLGGRNYEVARFRADGEYLDGRRPVRVTFSGEREDALRRDFTINGMFYDPLEDRLIDYVDGQRDLQEGIIRAIGSPDRRIEEDKLRMIRAIRFACRFNFRIAADTFDAIRRQAPEIHRISAERIRDELLKMLTGPNRSRAIRRLDEGGLLVEILPEVAAMKEVAQPPEFHPEGDVFTHTMLMLDLAEEPSPELALAILLHDIGKPPTYEVRERIRFDRHCDLGAEMARKLCRRLRLSSEQCTQVEELVRDHLKFMNVREMRKSRLKRFLRMEHFSDHLELHRLDCLGSHGDISNHEFCLRKLEEFQREALEESLRPPRLVTGHDLIAMGLQPGPVFGEILTALEDAQLEGEVKTRQEALDWIRRRHKQD